MFLLFEPTKVLCLVKRLCSAVLEGCCFLSCMYSCVFMFYKVRRISKKVKTVIKKSNNYTTIWFFGSLGYKKVRISKTLIFRRDFSYFSLSATNAALLTSLPGTGLNCKTA